MATENPLAGCTDIIANVLAYCPPHDFLYLASTSKTWRAVWVSACDRGRRTAISMAALTSTRTQWVVDDESFWLCARRDLAEMATTRITPPSFCNSDNRNDILCMTATAGNILGLKVAVRKLGWGRKGWNRKCYLARRRVPEIAAEIGHLEMLSWAVSEQGCTLSPFVWFFAAKGGNLDVLEWLRMHRCPKDLYSCAAGAAAGGSREALKWSRQRGHGWDRFVPYSAARAGNLEMLQWATRHGCPWDRHRCGEVAAANGHSTVVEWVNNDQE